MPVRINSNWRFESLPTSSVSNSRSRVMIWEGLATESFGGPVARDGRSTLPGAPPNEDCSLGERIPRFGSGSGSAHLLGLPKPACESRDRNLLDLEDLPNTHGLGRLPFDVFECSSSRCCNGWIRVRVHRFVDSIHCLGHGFRIVTRDVFCYGLRVNLASRREQTSNQMN